jgi:uncharacterized protein YndB with AHSA1/START domain
MGPTAKPKYDWSQFTLRILIDAPVSKVFKAWTDQDQVSQWFTTRTEIQPRKGGRLYFEWVAGDKWESEVLAVRKNQLFAFLFGDKGETVEVKFRKLGRKCICELHQYNIKTDPKSRYVMHRDTLQGWTFFLTNLKSWLEHGIDLRSHDPGRSYREGYINA